MAFFLLAVATILRLVDTTYGAARIGERLNLLAQLLARIDEFVLGSFAAYALVRSGVRASWRVRDNAAALAPLLADAAPALWLQR